VSYQIKKTARRRNALQQGFTSPGAVLNEVGAVMRRLIDGLLEEGVQQRTVAMFSCPPSD